MFQLIEGLQNKLQEQEKEIERLKEESRIEKEMIEKLKRICADGTRFMRDGVEAMMMGMEKVIAMQKGKENLEIETNENESEEIESEEDEVDMKDIFEENNGDTGNEIEVED
jgi:hypothetical protein